MAITPITPLNINSINPLGSTGKTNSTSALDQVGNSFGAVLESLNESQQNTDSLIQTLASGGDVDLHTVTIASEENDVNFRVAMAIRDKLVDAYREIMRMSV